MSGTRFHLQPGRGICYGSIYIAVYRLHAYQRAWVDQCYLSFGRVIFSNLRVFQLKIT